MQLNPIMNIEKLKDLVEYKFEALPEDVDPRDMFDDDNDVSWVYDQLDIGNESAWFIAKVSCSYKGFEGVEYLGGCSYKSFADFLEEKDGYYEDMKHAAFLDLVEQLEETKQAIQQLEE